ncbi:hypothetical protein [Tsukamurella sp. 1534]|uniref:hypothetical protein n=1 Tax=Tsukamurella sp. 1534 TaxID=1151061 RepID=UPI0002DF86FE|nr:hypothetical protein [Tsukamurella sp. 1534]
MPDDTTPTGFPITDTEAYCALVHEMFLAYLHAGFTEPQAMQLLCAHINSTDGGTRP